MSSHAHTIRIWFLFLCHQQCDHKQSLIRFYKGNKVSFFLHRLSCSQHCVKIVQIRSYFWSVFSCIWTEYGPEITAYLDTLLAGQDFLVFVLNRSSVAFLF